MRWQRERCGLGLRAAAAAAGISPGALTHVERDERGVSRDLLDRLAKLYGLDVGEVEYLAGLLQDPPTWLDASHIRPYDERTRRVDTVYRAARDAAPVAMYKILEWAPVAHHAGLPDNLIQNPWALYWLMDRAAQATGDSAWLFGDGSRVIVELKSIWDSPTTPLLDRLLTAARRLPQDQLTDLVAEAERRATSSPESSA